MTVKTSDLDAAVAVTRFGLGARPGEIDQARADPRGFLKAQISGRGADQPQGELKPSPERLADFIAFRDAKKAERAAVAAGQAPPQPTGGMKRIQDLGIADEFLARMQLAAATDAGFRERWTLFWANHFTVAATKGLTAPLVGPFEREAIRPHVFGRFEDLLRASTTHPAMLTYLDQERSAGPASAAGVRRRMGLNENLAREILELHTVGVDAGYTQADVTEFAKALTGWSMGGPNGPPDQLGRFVFRPELHEPGARTIMGRTYAQDGQAQADAVLKDLAASRHTARHIAVKLARHFVADDPPRALAARLEAAYLRSGGRLAEVARALLDAPEAWDPAARKIKTPYEFMVSSYRAADTAPRQLNEIAPTLAALGQRPFYAPSPKGWPDESAAWSAPDAVVKRIAWAQGFAARQPQAFDPVRLAGQTLGARLTPAAATAVARAESRPEALAILIMSPEFQRR